VAALIALSYGNPEGWVARRNLARYQATKQIDFWYLTRFSPNALPAIVSGSTVLSPDCRQLLIGRVGLQVEGARWFEWNYRASAARRALAVARAEPRAAVTEPPPGNCLN
jgi:hypothetical protein